MFFRAIAIGVVASVLSGMSAVAQPAAAVSVDVAGYVGQSGFELRHDAKMLRLEWLAGGGERAALTLGLEGGRPLIAALEIGREGGALREIMRGVNPMTLLTIGERDLRNPAGWVAFFDNPPLRAYRTVAAVLTKKSVRVTTVGARTVVRIGEVAAGAFRGVIELSVFRNSPLLLVETVLSTEEDGRAILYDAGLVAPGAGGAPWSDRAASTYSGLVPGPAWKRMAWLDTAGALQRVPAELNRIAEAVTVSRRMLVAENEGGSVAVFPPPHQYFPPLDSANNLGHVWFGAARNEQMSGYGFGVRQPPAGDKIWVPWINAPPRTEQRLGVFYLLSAGDARTAIDAASRFTRGDRYARLPGHLTFTSHYHIEHALELTKARTDGRASGAGGIPPELVTPGFVKTFKARGVDIVHLGEFHVGNMPRLPAPERIALLKTLHDECARLSDTELLVLPGEEPNVHLGGHWMSFFPKPVYWVLNRKPEEPFVEETAGHGKVYRVGSTADVLELMKRENGLMWTAHARIKGSRGFPDTQWEKDFFRDDRFLGAAWKAMPADLSQPRLGARVLDLLDDMANAGLKKYVLAEADMFRMEPDYESYAHMNINYVRLDRLPRFGDGWAEVLEALRGGKFFAGTGEVLIPEFAVAGKRSGETVRRAELKGGAGAAVVEFALEWTFPLAFAELVSGDGTSVHRQRIELSETEALGKRTWRVPADVAAVRWLRLEVWDVARNGAFTQPVWIEP